MAATAFVQLMSFYRMLERDPTKRPSAIEVLQEPFIQHRLQVSSLELQNFSEFLILFVCVSIHQNLHGRMSSRALVSPQSVAEEADAIARALYVFLSSPISLCSQTSLLHLLSSSLSFHSFSTNPSSCILSSPSS